MGFPIGRRLLDPDFTSAIESIERAAGHLRRPLRRVRMILSLGKNNTYADELRLWPLSGPMNNRNAYRKPVD
jgi:hypothetical protein